MGIGTSELLVIFLVVLLLFGAKRIPEIARSLGRASREFKNARDGLRDEIDKSADAADSEQEKR